MRPPVMEEQVRLVTWNCKGRGRDKVADIGAGFQADIFVLPEYDKAGGPSRAPDGFSAVSTRWERHRPRTVLPPTDGRRSGPTFQPSSATKKGELSLPTHRQVA